MNGFVNDSNNERLLEKGERRVWEYPFGRKGRRASLGKEEQGKK